MLTNSNGAVLKYGGEVWSRYIDENGNPVKRTPDTHPYNYDGFVNWRVKGEYNSCVYTDRLLMWDWDKHNRLCRKHFGNEGQYWNDRDPKLIEAFMRDWTENPDLKLVMVMQHCNQATGYPAWSLHFHKETE